MKLTILSENHSLRPELEAEYGLSIYVVKGATRLLFDAGCYGACLDNAKTLGIDLGNCTAMAFSHNHRDHCGGFLRITRELRPACPIYAHAGFFQNKWWDHSQDPPDQPTYGETLEPVGPPMYLDFMFQNRVSGFRQLGADIFPLGDEIYLVGNFPVPGGIEAVHPSSRMETEQGLALDTFREEQVCVLRTSGGLVVLTGCAHNGIMNILRTVRQRFDQAPIRAVFGGTHLVPPNPERIAATTAFFREEGIARAGVCHCTGPEGLAAFAREVPAYIEAGAGFEWTCPD